jgi:hypothetical protein
MEQAHCLLHLSKRRKYVMTQIDHFRPNEHLIQIKSRNTSTDYLPVQWRLVWFRQECPQGTIDTEEVVVDLDREMEAEVYEWNNEKRRSEKVLKRAKGYARFRAIVTDGKGGRATATGSESAMDFGDYIEKAETKSVGRALAMLGYGTQFAPEFAEGERIVDAPVARSQEVAAPSVPDVKTQFKAAKNRAYALGQAPNAEAWEGLLQHVCGEVVTPETATPEHLKQINEYLAKIEQERKASAA